MNEWLHDARRRSGRNWKDYALSWAFFGTMIVSAIGAIDHVEGGKHPAFLYAALLGVLVFAALVVAYIVRAAMHSALLALTRRLRKAA